MLINYIQKNFSVKHDRLMVHIYNLG
jgi:hypothetical protein